MKMFFYSLVVFVFVCKSGEKQDITIQKGQVGKIVEIVEINKTLSLMNTQKEALLSIGKNKIVDCAVKSLRDSLTWIRFRFKEPSEFQVGQRWSISYQMRNATRFEIEQMLLYMETSDSSQILITGLCNLLDTTVCEVTEARLIEK